MIRRLSSITLVSAAAALMASAVALSAAFTPGPAQRTVALAPPTTADGSDPFLWLEDKDGARAIAWVHAKNQRSFGVLQHDPHYRRFFAQALRINESPQRIPYPSMIGGALYNFWQDASHVRGIWRRTSLQSYRLSSPAWQTVLDLDAISRNEHANWVWKGSDCNEPQEQRCLIGFSEGGEDAQTLREFDVRTRAFVSGGFMLPRGKQDATWADPDTLLVAREWEPGQLTASGYPYIVKRLRRGQPLSSAVEVFRGQKSDVSVGSVVLRDGDGHVATLIRRGVTFFTTEYYIQSANVLRKLNVPPKTDLSGLIHGRLLLSLNEDWRRQGNVFPAGSLVAVDLQHATADPNDLHPTAVYTPEARESLGSVLTTKNNLILTVYHNVRGRAFVYTPAGTDAWRIHRLALPDNAAVDVVDTTLRNDSMFVVARSFLIPPTLYYGNAQTMVLEKIKALPAQFHAANDVVEQFEAVSSDGTKIPYFVVRPKKMRFDGSSPTVVSAYGGFQISETPNYSAITGKLWLEHGGVYVLANIRGGGEFGPSWHEAGLKTNRQHIYDDFYAVGKDLIARGITSPRRLGIVGGSNGGLLMGVEFTQHPEMWNAVQIAVPLLDMLRYEQIQAGASWVGEYGSVSVPAERAFLASISPYQNLRAGVAYPEPYIWTTTKDDRVGPQHARKFAAKLAEMRVPYLFYEVIEGGHGAGANLRESAMTSALGFTYFAMKLME